jgi:hypothetical protein
MPRLPPVTNATRAIVASPLIVFGLIVAGSVPDLVGLPSASFKTPECQAGRQSSSPPPGSD